MWRTRKRVPLSAIPGVNGALPGALNNVHPADSIEPDSAGAPESVLPSHTKVLASGASSLVMVQMISLSRQFEMQTRMLSTAEQNDRAAAQVLGRVG